jgi:hypothetical protein
MRYLDVGCRFLLGAVFAVSTYTKLGRPGAFASFVRSLRRMKLLPATLVGPAAVAVVTAEAASPLLLALPLTATAVAGFGVASVLLTAFGAAILISVRRGDHTPCQCFGRSSVPLGPLHAVRNGVLVGVAVLGVVASTTGGRAELPKLMIAAVAGLVGGGLVTVLDDIVQLFRPSSVVSSRQF